MFFQTSKKKKKGDEEVIGKTNRQRETKMKQKETQTYRLDRQTNRKTEKPDRDRR